MKLRNKKTGEIRDVESLGHEKSLRDEYGPQITLSWDTEYENLGECRTYTSLAEINEEWEDYEEPNAYYIGRCGTIEEFDPTKDVGLTEMLKEIGNYFETKEEAELAVEKLKAWKRLKEKGFRFSGWEIDQKKHLGVITIKTEPYYSFEFEDLDLLFGGEE